MHFARLVGIVPMGVGATLIIALWFSGEFSGAPFFFKVMGSFVATFFMIIGSGFLFAKMPAQGQINSMLSELKKQQQANQPEGIPSATGSAGYQCTACGATLESNADVSPHGDVKCEHCGRWFNIHKS